MDKHDKKHNPQQGADQKKDEGTTKVMDEQKKDTEKNQHDKEADKIGNFDV